MLWQKDSKENDGWYIDICHKLKFDPDFADLQLATNLYLKDLKQMNESSNGCKNNKKAIEYRRQGDIEFEMKNWHEAIELYNKSLCHAENNSQHIGLAYAKRAQCFSSMKRFDKCLIDIELAEKSNYPDDQLVQLEKRKQICLKLIECGAQVKLIAPKLDFGSRELFPEMANVLAFHQNDEYGTHVVATADIDVGQVILFEKCFATKTDEFYQHCNICMKGHTNLIPCPKCTTALFCCNTCEHNKIHLFECSIHPILKDHWHAIAMGVRTLLIGLNLFPNANELMEFVEEAVTNADALPTSITDAKSQYRLFLQNIKASFINSGGMKTSEKGLAFITPVMYRAVADHKLFNRFFTTEKHHRFLMHLVYYHMAIGHVAGTRTDFPIILQFLNHSCMPCINTFLVDGYVIGLAFRPIRKGEQVFKCYFDAGLTKMSVNERQKYLLEYYRFQCKCERCTIKDVPPAQCVRSLRSDPNFRFLNRFSNDSDESDQKERKLLTEKAKAVLRKHQVIWADGLECPTTVFRNLLVFKYNNKTEY